MAKTRTRTYLSESEFESDRRRMRRDGWLVADKRVAISQRPLPRHHYFDHAGASHALSGAGLTEWLAGGIGQGAPPQEIRVVYVWVAEESR